MWFEVDKEGLAAILERRGKSFAVFELISNAWDSGSDRVGVQLTPMPGEPYAVLEVEDFGEGFADPKDATTMFGRSRRAGELTKRGRFDLGEKLVLAVCRRAEIVTIGWALSFEPGERPRQTNKRRKAGTHFRAEIRMTRAELGEVDEAIDRLIPPVTTIYNGRELSRPTAITRFELRLLTEMADKDGILRRSRSPAIVELYKASEGDGELLELGIPVTKTENGYRINVLQKVPLNVERDGVPPGFIKTIEVALLNHVSKDLTQEQVHATWVQEAAGSALATHDAVRDVVTKRFGDRAVVTSVGDPLANAKAQSLGYTVVPGGALSPQLWENVRKHEVLSPAGRLFPTPKPADVIAAAEAASEKCPVCGK